ncbi:Pkinase domain-containing protein [Artemisia annua]|uniref:Pkinase domain-containing protein n=1 Tax=Artemisia annua TaxID=35608 RepID=A0A2U1NZR3_ARTAN|nr:Pkinase domain-containing protein [Artemisia annua]
MTKDKAVAEERADKGLKKLSKDGRRPKTGKPPLQKRKAMGLDVLGFKAENIRSFTSAEEYAHAHRNREIAKLTNEAKKHPITPDNAIPHEDIKRTRAFTGIKKKHSIAMDMWSLGCIMVELLSKQPLFNRKKELDHVDKVLLNKQPQAQKENATPMYKIAMVPQLTFSLSGGIFAELGRKPRKAVKRGLPPISVVRLEQMGKPGHPPISDFTYSAYLTSFCLPVYK